MFCQQFDADIGRTPFDTYIHLPIIIGTVPFGTPPTNHANGQVITQQPSSKRALHLYLKLPKLCLTSEVDLQVNSITPHKPRDSWYYIKEGEKQKRRPNVGPTLPMKVNSHLKCYPFSPQHLISKPRCGMLTIATFTP